MPNWKDYPYEETCPCCDYNMRFSLIKSRDGEVLEVECLSCGYRNTETMEYEQVDESEFEDED